jgi:hypothetical protein
MIDTTYNGWANWETWNIALWLGADEGLYRLVLDSEGSYEDFITQYKELLGMRTQDGAAWADSTLDYTALDEELLEMRGLLPQ